MKKTPEEVYATRSRGGRLGGVTRSRARGPRPPYKPIPPVPEWWAHAGAGMANAPLSFRWDALSPARRREVVGAVTDEPENALTFYTRWAALSPEEQGRMTAAAEAFAAFLRDIDTDV